VKVEYNFELLQDCQCSTCKVHNNSACIQQRTGSLKFVTCASEPPPNDVEGLYCSQGKGRSICSDLATSKACMCPTCAVWRTHELDEPYFCANGPAS
jgi:hypothetical protein